MVSLASTKKTQEQYMSSDKISIQSPFKETAHLLDLEKLNRCHDYLRLTKHIQYYFMSDDELLEVNLSSLGHDYYTDIITFDYSDDDDMESNEILISWDRIKENAETYKQSLKTELHRVCFHGMLHLSGIKDKTEEEQNNMTKRENELLALYCST
jgi:probable rRNA maturation factor